jgi:hypothetical protein
MDSASSGCFGSQYHGSGLINTILSDSSTPVTIRGTKDRLDWMCYSVVNTAVNNKSIECMLQTSEPPWFMFKCHQICGRERGENCFVSWSTGSDRMIDVVWRWWLVWIMVIRMWRRTVVPIMIRSSWNVSVVYNVLFGQKLPISD